jgi:capsular polysaccharide biosynthesis protein
MPGSRCIVVCPLLVSVGKEGGIRKTSLTLPLLERYNRGLGGFNLHDSQLNGRGHIPMTEPSVYSDYALFGETHENQAISSQGDPIRVIWRKLWLILLVGVVFAGLAAGFSLLQTPTYVASVKLLIGQKQSGNATNDLGNEVQGLQLVTSTMVQAVSTRPVAQDVIKRLHLPISSDAFLQNLSVQQVEDTQFVEVSYKDSHPKKAKLIANTIGEVFSDKVSEVSPSANAITATVWERAVVPDSPVSPNPVRNIVLALVLGLMLGIGLAFLLDYLDDDWRSPEEVEKVSGVPTFGAIPTFKARRSKKGGN